MHSQGRFGDGRRPRSVSLRGPKPRRRGLNSTLFRKFATECTEIAQRATSREQRALFLKMASKWERLAQSWQKKQKIMRQNYLRGQRREGLPSKPGKVRLPLAASPSVQAAAGRDQAGWSNTDDGAEDAAHAVEAKKTESEIPLGAFESTGTAVDRA